MEDQRTVVNERIRQAMAQPKECPERERPLEEAAGLAASRTVTAIAALDESLRQINIQIHRAIPSRPGKVSIRFNNTRRAREKTPTRRPVLVKWVKTAGAGRGIGNLLPRELREQTNLVQYVPRPLDRKAREIVNEAAVVKLLKLADAVMALRRELLATLKELVRAELRGAKATNRLLHHVEQSLPSIAKSIEYDWTDPIPTMARINADKRKRALHGKLEKQGFGLNQNASE